MKRILGPSVIVLGLAMGLSACTNPYDPGQRAVGGGLLGAGAGAAIGGIAGGGRGAAIGAVTGGALGAVGGAVTTPTPPPQPYYYQGYRAARREPGPRRLPARPRGRHRPSPRPIALGGGASAALKCCLVAARRDGRMKRRTFLAAGAAALAAPSLARAADLRLLKFIPQSDLTVLDPIWTTAYVTRNHGFMVFDTLYGTDAQYAVSPQMVAGAVTEDDGKPWKLTLRDGLKFHDGEPGAGARLRRQHRALGQARRVRPDADGGDRRALGGRRPTIVFRLKTPFPLLPDALGKSGSNVPAIMPERLAKTDPFTQVTEMVGSGPFRSWPTSGCRAASSSMSATPATCRAAAARRA